MVVQEYRKVLKLHRGCLYVLVPGILYPHPQTHGPQVPCTFKGHLKFLISGYLFAVWSSLSTCWGIPHWAWQTLPNPLLQHGGNLSSREATQPQVCPPSHSLQHTWSIPLYASTPRETRPSHLGSPCSDLGPHRRLRLRLLLEARQM